MDRIVELFLASNNLAADSPDAACAYGGAGPGGAGPGGADTGIDGFPFPSYLQGVGIRTN